MGPEVAKATEIEDYQGGMSPPPSAATSVEHQTPEPAYAIQYGHNLERFDPEGGCLAT